MRTNLDFKMRLFRIDQLIRERGPISFEQLLAELKCSTPTVKRDLKYMREVLKAPIVYSARNNGYEYAPSSSGSDGAGQPVVLPATWFSPTEMYVIMSALQMFGTIEQARDGLLFNDMQALKARVLALLENAKIPMRELQRRVRVFQEPVRIYKNTFFEVIGNAIADKKRLSILYYTRSKKTQKEREVSPLRLVCYRNRWYLDAWCHETDTLKTFSLACVRNAVLLTKASKPVALRQLEQELDRSYGLFSGGRLQIARIAVDSEMGVYVKDEVWHKDQKMEVSDDDSLVLEVPYASAKELSGQILRLGEHAKVLAPESLRRYVQQTLQGALSQYLTDKPGR